MNKPSPGRPVTFETDLAAEIYDRVGTTTATARILAKEHGVKVSSEAVRKRLLKAGKIQPQKRGYGEDAMSNRERVEKFRERKRKEAEAKACGE